MTTSTHTQALVLIASLISLALISGLVRAQDSMQSPQSLWSDGESNTYPRGQQNSALVEENKQLQASFNLMIRQLSERDVEIQRLRERIAELEYSNGTLYGSETGCAVDTARRLIMEESFIYDREQVLLGWLADNVSSCVLLELQQLDEIANDASLTQSRATVLREMGRRGEEIPQEALLGIPSSNKE